MRGAIFIASLLVLAEASCPNMCSSFGTCNAFDQTCTCMEGFMGGDCSQRICPSGKAWADKAAATDDAHNEVECSTRGTCDRSLGQCTCDVGFEGLSCNRKTCPNSCSNRGVCRSMGYQATLKDPGSGTVYTYDEIWDHDMMYGCVCDEGYEGYDCSIRTCPTGDDPLTGDATDTVNGLQYNEKQKVFCRATSGTFTLTFRGETTAHISTAAVATEVATALTALSTVTDVTVSFSGTSTQACTFNGNAITVEFIQDFGDLPELQGTATSLVHSSTSLSPTLTISTLVTGTKEDSTCSNRGLCDTVTGTCTCFTNYETSDGLGGAGQRGDCGYDSTFITACPGEISCSSHGVCLGPPTNECTCSNGWQGGDCSERVCALGRSWFHLPTADNTAHLVADAECSDMGTCDRATGECTCATGFEGSACERMSCPGTTACNLQGTCVSMSVLATYADDNGLATSYTYGNIPNDPTTWDHSKMQGCLCDDGYEGHDCSLFSCPTGDDPYTPGLVEKQKVSCQMTGTVGTFRLGFRQAETVSLDYTATAAEVQAALEDLSTLSSVVVEYADSTSTSVCSSAGTSVYVTFNGEFGDLPLLTSSLDGVDAVFATELQQGTKEDAVCSNRGICDHTTGICSCFYGLGSSDGFNNNGDRGDCGFILPEYSSSNQEGNTVGAAGVVIG